MSTQECASRKRKLPSCSSSKHQEQQPDMRKVFAPVQSKSQSHSSDWTKLLAKCETEYGMKMPDDFAQLWRLCQHEQPQNPRAALKESLGVVLVGPFDILAGASVSNPLLHYRYYYDPPEVWTVLVSASDANVHYSYFRDDPGRPPAFLVSNDCAKGCVLKYAADNLLELVHALALQALAETTDHIRQQRLHSLAQRIAQSAAEGGVRVECRKAGLKARKRASRGSTFHGLGVVVPVENDVGYRDQHETDAKLKLLMDNVARHADHREKMLAAFAPLHEQVTFVQFANDESDFGMGLELGLDFFLHGAPCFHKTAGKLLPVAYNFLHRPLYARVIEAHLGCRQRDPKSILHLR